MNSVAETIGMETATTGPGMSEVAVARPEQYLPAQALKLQGQAAPLGTTLSPEGANFSVFSASATGFIISLFDHVDALTPRKSIRLDPKINRMGHYWNIFIPELKAGQIYVYRAEGPNNPPNVSQKPVTYWNLEARMATQSTLRNPWQPLSHP